MIKTGTLTAFNLLQHLSSTHLNQCWSRFNPKFNVYFFGLVHISQKYVLVVLCYFSNIFKSTFTLTTI
ncbi:MAG: hypothetical protein C0599_18225 [Salinivirgaceae bacterium]|nr:MAG: hypothetical protein C0599_18225 [Salinivirgaceae bacterium]